jgi:GPH family glycoside/pentoside/hexuronide:cation symporter
VTNSNAPAVQQEEKVDLPLKVKIGYCIYPVFNAMSSTMALSFLVFFVTDTVGLSPTTMASVYTIARFGDLGVQLFAPSIVNNLTRVRPLLIIIPIISQTGTILSFLNPPLPYNAKLVLLIVAYCCIHFPMNFSTVVANTIMMKVTRGNLQNRLWIPTTSSRIGSVWRIFNPYLQMPLISLFIKQGLPGYFIVTCIFAVMTMIAHITLFIISAPYEESKEEAAAALAAKKAAAQNVPKGPSIIQQYAMASKNVPAMAMLIGGIVTGITGQVMSGGMQYYWAYSIGNRDLQARAGSISGMLAVPLSFIGPVIGRKMGMRKAMITNQLWTAMCYILYYLFADGNAWGYIIIASISALSTYPAMIWGTQTWLDSAEVQLQETGVDIRPFVMGLTNYSVKIGFIAQGPIMAWWLNSVGYQAGVGIADMRLFMLIWMGFPFIGQLFYFCMFFFFYKITPERAAEARQANQKAAEERMAAAREAAGEAPAAAR